MNIPFDIVRNHNGIPYDVEVLAGPDSAKAVVFANVHAVNLVRRYGDEDRQPAGYNAFTKGETIDLTQEERGRVKADVASMEESLAKARAALAEPVS